MRDSIGIVTSVESNAMEPDVTPSFLLASVYLWPFFAASSWNRPSWSGLNREGYNRFLGIGALCLLDFFALLAFLQPDLAQKLSKTAATLTFLTLLAVHKVWLDGSRGDRLKRRYLNAPPRTRSIVRAVSATIFGGLLVWFFVTLPPFNSRSLRSMDCGNAGEVSAASCDSDADQ